MFGLTRDIQRIDALYERLTDGAILFFSGRKYWRSDGNLITGDLNLLANPQPTVLDPRPRDISDFGIGSNVTQLDAVFVWGKNKKTYFFAGDEYWR